MVTCVWFQFLATRVTVIYNCMYAVVYTSMCLPHQDVLVETCTVSLACHTRCGAGQLSALVHKAPETPAHIHITHWGTKCRHWNSLTSCVMIEAHSCVVMNKTLK